MADHRPCTARNETPLERADRSFAELLQEPRVTQTGGQILFAFLLSLAFTSRFPDLDAVQRATYVTTLLLAVLAAALFTAPAALHRSLFRKGAKPRIAQVSSQPAALGLGVLVLAFTGSVLLVVDVTAGRAGGVAAGAATLLVCLGLWGLLPRLVQRAKASGERESADGPPAARGRGGASRRVPSVRRVRPDAPVQRRCSC
ncbi:DUF6328 family protein [Streptomyces sp. NPDC006134]|uniref:DUF6328 family protein n=1 Tax=Streptomyces sp. NPDC006134 TaxID=3154467 RepID=UPI0033E0EB3A